MVTDYLGDIKLLFFGLVIADSALVGFFLLINYVGERHYFLLRLSYESYYPP